MLDRDTGLDRHHTAEDYNVERELCRLLEGLSRDTSGDQIVGRDDLSGVTNYYQEPTSPVPAPGNNYVHPIPNHSIQPDSHTSNQMIPCCTGYDSSVEQRCRQQGTAGITNLSPPVAQSDIAMENQLLREAVLQLVIEKVARKKGSVLPE